LENRIPAATLLPYLNSPGGACHFRISPAREDRSGAERNFPFSVVGDSDPLTRLIEAEIVTDGGSKIARLFLLVQKDRYIIPRDPFWPLNNRIIDDLWQKAFQSPAIGRRDPDLLLFSDQTDERGGLKPMQSLFFCRKTALFFAPPCPQCGSPLEQCYDDSLLTGSGLPGYSVSLKRYLHCPACLGGKGAGFYAYEADHSDPPGVGDLRSLIRDFASLLVGRGKSESFPCLACSHIRECYGAGFEALFRIVPFSFYPFYMFAFRAPSLHALDFLPLISGASIEEVETELRANGEWGRIGSLAALKEEDKRRTFFLFKEDERFFLEVLYLKLSLLGNLIGRSFSGREGFGEPVSPLSIEKTWIELGVPGGLLPLFWNFKVKSMGLGAPSADPRFLPRFPASYGLYSAGLTWFYCFLVNGRTGMSMVHPFLKEAIDRSLSETDFSFEEFIRLNGFQSSFPPAGIFWSPEGREVREIGHPLWEKVLLLGWSLLRAGFKDGGDWKEDEFLKEWGRLREEVKGCLFREAPAGVAPVLMSDPGREDEAIYGILSGLLGKGSAGREIDEIDEEDMKETLILGTAARADMPSSPSAEEEIESPVPETVVLIPAREGMGRGAFPRGEDVGDRGPVRRSEGPFSGQDFLTETVILGPTGIGSAPAGKSPGREVPPPEEMDETVVLGERERENPPREDDFLAETVVVQPGRGREKKEKRGP
jgi:hypothetical protein